MCSLYAVYSEELHWNCVIGKSKILFLLRNWKIGDFIPTV